jgi:ABC-type phosphate transport system permease subunit
VVVIAKVPAVLPAISVGIVIAIVRICGDIDPLIVLMLGDYHPSDGAEYGAEYAERNSFIPMPPSS